MRSSRQSLSLLPISCQSERRSHLFVLVLGLTLSLLGRLLLLVVGRVLVVLGTRLLTLAILVGRGDLDHDIGGLTHNLGLEALLGIGGVLDGADESVAVDDRVAALDHAVVAGLLTVLVVGELIVLDVESELVGSVVLNG